LFVLRLRMPALGAVHLRLICGWLVGQFLQLKLELLRLLVRVDAGATEGGQDNGRLRRCADVA